MNYTHRCLHSHKLPLLILLIAIVVILIQPYSIHAAANSSNTTIRCLTSQSSALLQLKSSFHDASRLSSWQPDTDCCRWEGVTCRMASGHVVVLDLSDGYLQSNGLHPALFNLTLLTNLALSGNDFMGAQLPDSGFERLSKLVSLDLSATNFAGQIPIGIGNLSNMLALDLSHNPNLYLTEPSFQTFIANLSNLRELYLDEMDLSSSGATWSSDVAASAPQIQILSFMSCGLSGFIDPSFSRLRSLTMINVRLNVISGMVPEFFANFSFLTILELSGNAFEGQFPTKIFQLKRLQFIDLYWNNKLCVQLPEFLPGSRLEVLDLILTNRSNAIPASVVNLKYLKHLGLTTVEASMNSDILLIRELHWLEVLRLYGGSGQGKLVSFSWIGSLKHLTYLELGNYNFSGLMPSSIINLTNLTSLTLYNCSMSGPIPSWIGNLIQLNNLNFRNNNLNGTIPKSIFALPALQSLYLDSNQLSGHLEDIPVPLSSSVYDIDLSNNWLHGPIPKSFFCLPNLEYLNLESNHLTGIVELRPFWRLRSLYFLGFSNNKLSVIDGEDSPSQYLPKIQHLGLACCNLTKLPRILRHLYDILELDLSSNKIGGVIPGWIWEIWKDTLGSLDLSNNAFTSLENSPSLVTFTHLSHLNLSFNRLQGEIPIPAISLPYGVVVLDYSNNGFSSILRTFGRYLNKVAYINLSKNKLKGYVPISICSMKKLQFLYLSDNNFSGFVPSCLVEGRSLRVLNLRGNKFNGMLPKGIKEGCKLETIDLNSNQIEGRLPRTLSNCKSLELLDVSNNHILDLFPLWLGNLPKLRVLVLRSNQLYGTIKGLHNSDLTRDHFSSLQILDLANNTLSGQLPPKWFEKLKSMMANVDDGQVLEHQTNFSQGFIYRDIITITYKGFDMTFNRMLTTFKAIDFSNNSFVGVIPGTIGSLVSLHGLNMSHNNFTGAIPQQLGNLAQLESLDLSWNQLSGVIPHELTFLTSLSWLNLSNNNLTGRIPQSNQFLSFSNSSFEGNLGLCGRPLSKDCDSSGSITPNTEASSEDSSLWQDKVGVILMFVFAGLGFVVGFMLTIIFQLVCQVKGGTYCIC
ncbi:receptor-like protein 7 isoform X1 [Oryza sativa Japonica Group]|uniref:non-specific serine/threonine protein kinase n=1 Tax=Oryza sativa subsp. japonica TaxID=39947 RepID=B9ET06_ORYSJ|nr:hypothetical protein OsJ_00482 [Oryza sativa Japonica Group]